MTVTRAPMGYDHWKNLCPNDVKSVWFLTQDPMRVHHPTRKLVYSQLKEIFAKKLRQGGSLDILDLGCGIGNENYFLAEMDLRFRYTGVDVTPRFVDIGTSMFQHAKFISANAVDSTFDDESFDVVLIRHLLEHLTPADAETCIRKALKATRTAVVLTMFTPFKKTGDVEVIDHGDYIDTTFPIRWLTQIVSKCVRHTQAFLTPDLEGNQVVILHKSCDGC